MIAPLQPTADSCLVARINSHEFLLDERDGKGLGDNSTAVAKTLYHIDLNGATDISDKKGSANLLPFAVMKTSFLDLVAALMAAGVDPKDIPAKLEGLAFGPDIMVGNELEHTLFVTNDSDFLGTTTDSNHDCVASPPGSRRSSRSDSPEWTGHRATSRSSRCVSGRRQGGSSEPQTRNRSKMTAEAVTMIRPSQLSQ